MMSISNANYFSSIKTIFESKGLGTEKYIVVQLLRSAIVSSVGLTENWLKISR